MGASEIILSPALGSQGSYSNFAELCKRPSLAADQRFRRSRQYFRHIGNAASRFGVELRRFARTVNDLIRPFDPADPAAMLRLQRLLDRYVDIMTPWAEATSRRLIQDVAQRDASAWYRLSRDLGAGLRDDITYTPIGATVQNLLDSQVGLIRDMPLEAGRQMQQLALEVATGGRRYSEIVPRIREIHDMTTNRATLIARTETAKAQSAITQARSLFIGADQYVWHTARDLDVRPAHRVLHGKTFSWSDPPVAERNGTRHHPGQFPNCRCWSEPILRTD